MPEESICRTRLCQNVCGGGVKAQAGSITDLSCFQEKFDYVTSITVLLHLPYESKKQAVAEIGKVLGAGGKAILIETTCKDPAPHVYGWSVRRWKSEFRKNGMKCIYSEAHMFNFVRRLKIFQHRYLENAAIFFEYGIEFLLMQVFRGKESDAGMQHLMVFEKE